MTVEDRVTAALQALAEGVTPPLDGEQQLTTRLRREHRNRRVVAILGTAAAVFAVVGVVSLGGSSGSVAPAPLATHGPPSVVPSPEPTEASASPAPTYPPPAAGVGGPRWFLALESGGRWAFRDARTGESSGLVQPSGYTVTAVAAGGAERSYYTAATKGKCGPVKFDRVDVRNGTLDLIGNHDVPHTNGLRGRVYSMAVSHDGTKLAYSIATKVDPVYPDECSSYVLRVLNLRSGATRTWTGGDATLDELNWAPDDRTLLFHAQGCCGDYQPGVTRLDTRGPGTSFTDAPTVPGTDSMTGCGGASSTASSGAEVFAAQDCFGQEQESIRIVVIDPVTGQVRRQVTTIVGFSTVVSFSVSHDGEHVLLSTLTGGPPKDFRVDDATVSELPTHLERIAW